MKVLSLRFAQYGLTIHPQKTKRVDFTRPEGNSHKGNGSFTFLEFTHYWVKSRKGMWIIGRKTDSKRLSRGLKAIAQWCREHRHLPRKEQHKALSLKLKGHYAYYGISRNYEGIAEFYEEVRRVWLKWVNRCSSKGSKNWERFKGIRQFVPYIIRDINRRWERIADGRDNGTSDGRRRSQ